MTANISNSPKLTLNENENRPKKCLEFSNLFGFRQNLKKSND